MGDSEEKIGMFTRFTPIRPCESKLELNFEVLGNGKNSYGVYCNSKTLGSQISASTFACVSINVASYIGLTLHFISLFQATLKSIFLA